jgi:predicted glutamine amidotransferase
MCLIIHQPEGATTPVELLHSAAEYNPDGFGFMGFDAAGKPRIERSGGADIELATRLAEEFAGRNCAFHFRRRTRGSSHAENLHPFKIAPGLYLMHNGTANVELRLAGRSDTWHLVHDYLAPFLGSRRRLIYDRAFRHILDAWLGPQNRIVFLDEAEGRIELLHRADGLDWNGLWLSNARWVDRRLLSLAGHDGVYRASEASFC